MARSRRTWLTTDQPIWHAGLVLAVTTAASLLIGCGDPPTVVLAEVHGGPDAEAGAPSAPAAFSLRAIVARAADPAQEVSSVFRSPFAGDAADGRGPFQLPVVVAVNVGPSFAGAVNVTVQGLDANDAMVVQVGSASTEVVVRERARVIIQLAPAPSTDPPDGGAD